MSFDWSPENIETLRTLWAEGKSATEIGAIMGGRELSRNAVIGKLHRLKVYRDGPAVRGVRPQRRTKSNERRAASQREWNRQRRETERLARESGTHPVSTIIKVPKKAKSVMNTTEPVSKRLTIFALRDGTEFSLGTCKWPSGDYAPYSYCGHDAASAGPYCPFHKARSRSNGGGTELDVDRIAARAMGGIRGHDKSTIMET